MEHQKILKKLGVLRTYHKNKSPNLSVKYYDNMKWTRKKFHDQFKGDWTKVHFIKNKLIMVYKSFLR